MNRDTLREMIYESLMTELHKKGHKDPKGRKLMKGEEDLDEMKIKKNSYRDYDELVISQDNTVQFKKEGNNYLVRYVTSNSWNDKDIMKFMPKMGETGYAGRYSYKYDGSLNPAKLNKAKFEKLLSAVDKGWKRYAKSFADFYANRQVADGKVQEAPFGFTGVPFPSETPNEFAYIDFKKHVKKNEKNIKKILKAGGDRKVFTSLEKIWSGWDKKTNKGEYSNIKGNKFGRELALMLRKDGLVFDNSGNKITKIKEASNVWKRFDAMQKLQGNIMDVEDEMRDITNDLKQLHMDMEQEAEPGGGRVADRYGRDIEKKEKEYKKKKAEFKKLMKQLDKLEQF